MNNKKEIKPCPFKSCGNKKPIVGNESFFSIKSYQVICQICLCKGPNATTPEEAIEKWNSYSDEQGPDNVKNVISKLIEGWNIQQKEEKLAGNIAKEKYADGVVYGLSQIFFIGGVPGIPNLKGCSQLAEIIDWDMTKVKTMKDLESQDPVSNYQKCERCDKQYEEDWSNCPYCLYVRTSKKI